MKHKWSLFVICTLISKGIRKLNKMLKILHLSVNKSCVCLSLILVASDSSLKCVDHMVIRVMFIIVEHAKVLVFLDSKNTLNNTVYH